MHSLTQHGGSSGISKRGKRRDPNTLNSTYNEKKYAEILLRYRRLFIKDDVFKGE